MKKKQFPKGTSRWPFLDGVRDHGQPIKIVSKYDRPGYWIGIQIDRENRKLRGGTPPLLSTLQEGL